MLTTAICQNFGVKARPARLSLTAMFRFVIILFALLVTATMPAVAGPTTLEIITDRGRVEFTIEVADTAAARQTGLMHRDSMPADYGMLFDFKTTQPVAMWMKNTLIPLDMLFVAADGRITNIIKRAAPLTLTGRHSAAPVRAVLELNGGTTDRLGIKPGDRLIHPMFTAEHSPAGRAHPALPAPKSP